jgi:hypothetical protein
MSTKALKNILIVFVALSFFNCAGIVHGTKQEIPINSNPAGAKVYVNDFLMATTPTVLHVQRKSSGIIKIEKEGYEPVLIPLSRKMSGWIWGNIGFSYFGLITAGIDLTDGAAYKLTPDMVNAMMEKKDGAAVAAVNRAFENKGQPSYVDRDIPITDIENRDAIAVIIGNGDYENKDIPTVDYAINDAQTVREYLIKVLGYKEGNIIYAPNASKAKFESIFGTESDHKGILYNYMKKSKSDIFVYYSGHGAPDIESKGGYFVPADANPMTIKLTGYPLERFYGNLAKIASDMKVPNVFVVVDACFSGSSERGLLLKNVSPISITVKSPLIAMPNAVVMTSSKGAEVSSWYPEENHSMFTFIFLKTLKDMVKDGKKTITASELYSKISDETEGLPYYARRFYGRIQTPQIMGDRNRVFLHYE